MKCFILLCCILQVQSNRSIAINFGTGTIFSSTYPIAARKGDLILFCPMPPISSLCHEFDVKLGECLTSENLCSSFRFDKNIIPGSIFQLNGRTNKMIPSTTQPHRNPSIHCLILSRGNGVYWETCMKYLKYNLGKTHRTKSLLNRHTMDGNNFKEGPLFPNYSEFENKVLKTSDYYGGTIIVRKNQAFLSGNIMLFELTYFICFAVYYIYTNE